MICHCRLLKYCIFAKRNIYGYRKDNQKKEKRNGIYTD